MEEDISLEEIPIAEYEAEQQARKRKRNKMKKDVYLKLSTQYMRSRVDDVKVELRCQDPASDVIEVELSVRQLLHRPTCAGARVTHNLGLPICKMYLNRLCNLERRALIDVPEVPMTQREQHDSRMIVEEIEAPVQASVVEVPELVRERDIPTLDVEMSVNVGFGPNASAVGPNVSAVGPNVSAIEPNVSTIEPNVSTIVPNVSAEREMVTCVAPHLVVEEVQDISLLPTQKLSEVQEIPSAPKRRRTTNERRIMIDTGNKENQPPNKQLNNLSEMLHEAGISDIPEKVAEREIEYTTRRKPSENSETPLGSLDRTRVSLGDTDSTTDSQRMIRENWGTFNTMVRIFHCKAAGCDPLNVMGLLARGPVLPGHGRLTAAKCFSSLLKLKQHRFIRIEKDPITLEIVDINLGPRFDRP